MVRSSPSEVQSGLLLIADVSGYTAYLSGVELEHSTTSWPSSWAHSPNLWRAGSK